MSTQEWPAHEYQIGSYIQATVADMFLPRLSLSPDASVLDIGCGNGAYSERILKLVPKGSVLGIDASENMLELAQEVVKKYPNFSVEQADVLNLPYEAQFDCVVSFWCLQWVPDLPKVFTNIARALKPGGTVFLLFPYGDDPFIESYYALKKSGLFPILNRFISPVDYETQRASLERVPNCLWKEWQVRRESIQLRLPSLDIFRKFVNGIAFYQKQIPEADIKLLNEAMVQHYASKHQEGIYSFDGSVLLISAKT